MKILIATDVFPPKSGGSGWSTFHLARALQRRGHFVYVALPKLGVRGVETRVYEGVPVAEVGYTASNVPGLRAWQRTRAIEASFSAYLAERASEFDLIHAQHVLSIAAAAGAKKIARAKKRANIPVVSTVRDYWAVCLYGTLWRDEGVCPICRGGEITRCLAQKYGAGARLMLPLVPLVEAELARRQRALQGSDAVIAVSGFVGEMLRGVVEGQKLYVVPNLIDVEETRSEQVKTPPPTLPLRREVGKSKMDAKGGREHIVTGVDGRTTKVVTTKGKPYLMFIGKLNALKGADLLPEIIGNSGVGARVVVAGDGELKGELSQIAGFDVRGWISNAETLELLANATALLFPSRWAEPLARTLLEAQALGVPTVAFNVGGNRDIIEDSFNGLLADSVEEFAKQVRRVVFDGELRARLGANAVRVAQEKFSAEHVTERLELIYASVMRR